MDKCSRCNPSKCCTYMTEPLGSAPRSKDDFAYLLWQVSHQDIELYKDSDGWFLLFNSQCEHLATNGSCMIYENRPQVCRDYSNDWCEFDEPASGHFEFYFRNYQELLTYCKKRFKRWEV